MEVPQWGYAEPMWMICESRVLILILMEVPQWGNGGFGGQNGIWGS